MINVLISKKENKTIKIVVSGHANFKKHGEDLVCAGVSSIIYGAINAFIELEQDISYEILDQEDNKIIIKLNNPTEQTELLNRMIICQLKTIESSYKKYLKINFE